MPKLNVDESVFELIELTLNGKQYSVKEVNQDMLKRIQETVTTEDDNVPVVYRQLGILLGVEADEFKGTDLRKAGAALRFLQDSITSQIEGKSGNA